MNSFMSIAITFSTGAVILTGCRYNEPKAYYSTIPVPPVPPSPRVIACVPPTWDASTIVTGITGIPAWHLQDAGLFRSGEPQSRWQKPLRPPEVIFVLEWKIIDFEHGEGETSQIDIKESCLVAARINESGSPTKYILVMLDRCVPDCSWTLRSIRLNPGGWRYGIRCFTSSPTLSDIEEFAKDGLPFPWRHDFTKVAPEQFRLRASGVCADAYKKLTGSVPDPP